MHVHPKALGHEAQGANFVGGTRKRPPHNPDEVGAVKDHFSEDQQQQEKRQPPPRQAIEAKKLTSAEPEAAGNSWQASQALAAKGAVLALQPFLKDAVPEGEPPAVPSPEPPKDPSLDDLLALMCAKP